MSDSTMRPRMLKLDEVSSITQCDSRSVPSDP
jgi:hypothetical protein